MWIACHYCSEEYDDEDYEIERCSCGYMVCNKCAIGQGESSAGRKHYHAVCQITKEYEDVIRGLQEEIERLKTIISGKRTF